MTTVKIAVLGFVLWLALRGRKAPPSGSADPGGEPPLPDWGDWGEEDGDGPVVGEFWSWADLPDLPLLSKSGRLWGIYSPRVPFNLIAVVDSAVKEGNAYLVVSVNAMTGFPARFPTK